MNAETQVIVQVEDNGSTFWYVERDGKSVQLAHLGLVPPECRRALKKAIERKLRFWHY